MRRLLINPGTPEAWETMLKPGTYRFGREEGNDFQIDHPSVSSRHCEVVVDDAGVLLRDLGSVNGTYLEGARVNEARLRPGQSVQLGSVEFVLEELKAPPAGSPPVPPPADIRVPPRVAAPPDVVVMGAVFCKFHPNAVARFFCDKCRKFYCDMCVTTRKTASEAGKYCRMCGASLAPVEARGVRPKARPEFFQGLSDVWAYPFRGSGLLMLGMVTVVYAGIDFVLNEFLGIFYRVSLFTLVPLLLNAIVLSYVYLFMQNIIHGTAAGEEEMPELPMMEGLISAFGRLMGTVLISFGPMLVLGVYAYYQKEPAAGVAMVPAVIFGCLYFPMAFLAVAMKDNVLAANPLVVVPSILKVPKEYLVTAVLLGVVAAVHWQGDQLMMKAKLTGYHTHSMNTLLVTLGLRLVWNFVSIYLLVVNMHLLGRLYLTRKDKLEWF